MADSFRSKALAFLLLFLMISGTAAATGPIIANAANTTYYVDTVNGDDGNSGTSPDTAWKTLDKVNGTVFGAGDQILLARDQIFYGTCAPQGSGTSTARITLGAYGTGDRPIIDAGTNVEAIRLVDQSYWNIQDIETTHGTAFGIFVGVSGSYIIITDISILNCYAHDVYGEGTETATYEKLKGGIIASAIYPYNAATGQDTSATKGCQINNLTVDGCSAGHTDRWSGIMLACASWGCAESGRANNTVVQNCYVTDTYGDGIVILISRNSLIQNCVSDGVGCDPVKDVGTPSGIWTYSCSDTVVRFCEAYGTRSPEIDGGGFDMDIGSARCRVEYNYSHDNQAYGAMIFAMKEDWNRQSINYYNTDPILRYNIFSNNGRGYTRTDYVGIGDFFIAIWNGGQIKGPQIYNNTSYWNPVVPAPALVDNFPLVEAVYSDDLKFFMNNIIYSTSENARMMNIQSGKLQCDYNIYYNAATSNPVFIYGGTAYTGFGAYRTASGQDAHSLNIDPQLGSPTYASIGMPTTEFTLNSTSPAINAGTDVGTMGDRDFLGNTVPQDGAYDIGACEYTGIVFEDTEPPTAPSNLTATAVSSSRIDLSWTASADNVCVAGYEIYRDGQLAGTSASASFSDTGLLAGTTYGYYVRAYDAALNYSPASNTADATTLTGGGSTVLHVNSLFTCNDLGNPVATFTRPATVYWKVMICDGNNYPISGVSVTTNVYKPDGTLHVTKVGTTGSDGVVSLSQSYPLPSAAGTYTIQVESVSLSGYTYDPAANVITSCTFLLK